MDTREKLIRGELVRGLYDGLEVEKNAVEYLLGVIDKERQRIECMKESARQQLVLLEILGGMLEQVDITPKKQS